MVSVSLELSCKTGLISDGMGRWRQEIELRIGWLTGCKVTLITNNAIVVCSDKSYIKYNSTSQRNN